MGKSYILRNGRFGSSSVVQKPGFLKNPLSGPADAKLIRHRTGIPACSTGKSNKFADVPKNLKMGLRVHRWPRNRVFQQYLRQNEKIPFVGRAPRQRHPTFRVGFHCVPPDLQEIGEGIVQKTRFLNFSKKIFKGAN